VLVTNVLTYHTVTGLERGQVYKFAVSAINYVGTGVSTEPITLVAS